MAVTQYIGARYVPIIADPIEWSSANSYEPLTIVTNEGNSYTSRQFVPTGIDIDNENYWAATGNYNAQIEQYRQEVVTVSNGIQSLQEATEQAVTAMEDVYTPEMYGALGDGVNDDTSAFVSMMQDANVKFITLIDGVYNVGNIEITKSIYSINSKFIWNGNNPESSWLDVTEDNLHFNELVLDCNNLPLKNALNVQGNDNCFNHVHIEDLPYTGTQTANRGILIQGNNNKFISVVGKNFYQLNSGNDSCPQMIALMDKNQYTPCTNNCIISAIGDNIRAGIVAANTGVTDIDSIMIFNGHDNGLYVVRGGKVNLNSIQYDGDNEAVACITDTYDTDQTKRTSANIGMIKMYSGQHALRIENIDVININAIEMYGSFQHIIYLGQNNVNSRRLSVNSISMTGVIEFPFFMPQGRGYLYDLIIGNIFIFCDYPISQPSVASFMNLYCVRRVDIQNMDLTVRDTYDVLDTGSIFRMRLNSVNVESWLRNFTFRSLDSHSQDVNFIFRIERTNQYVNTNFGVLSGDWNIDLYGNADYKFTDGFLSANNVPTGGTWNYTQMVKSARPGVTNCFGWVCVGEGTPGTWKKIPLESLE